MQIKEKASKSAYPVKVVQFGEGNFLRAFVDWMIDIANECQKIDQVYQMNLQIFPLTDKINNAESRKG